MTLGAEANTITVIVAVVAAAVALVVVEKLSNATADMVNVMQSMRPDVDLATMTVTHKNDSEALARVNAAGERVAELRNEFMRLSRRELGTNPEPK